jgi:hypothetical protein
MSEFSYRNAGKTVIGICAVPVLSIWALVSFLPIVGLLTADKPLVFLIADLLFLMTGFVGLISPVIAAVFLTRPGSGGAAKNILKGRLVLITLYATVWLALYWVVSIAAG